MEKFSTKSTIVSFFYHNQIGIALRRYIVIKKIISTLAGRLADMRLSRFFIKTFIKKYTINVDESLHTNLNNYYSLNDFFIRKLKPSARPIDKTPLSIVSPADGTLYVAEHINKQTELFVKGKTFDIKKFLGNQSLATTFYGGTLVVIYIAPHHYHRFHFPCDGVAYKTKKITGNYESVQPMVYQTGMQPLIENERQVNIIETKDCGIVTLVAVGALCIGRITQTYKSGKHYTMGTEMGYFSFGGSTIVLFFERNRIKINQTFRLPPTDNYNNDISVKMGQKIGTKK